MKVFPIDDPVAGEQLLRVQPVMDPDKQGDWRQRLEYFTGRALTHTALQQEQQSRSGHLATLGRALSPGVVMGLETSAAETGDGLVIEIATGMGIATSGEIVHINRNQQAALDDIRVYAPSSLLNPDGENSQEIGSYKLGDTLGHLRALGRSLPQVMVLVLQPVVVEHFMEPASTDPCDYDPTDEAFQNWQWLDACRLALYTWNTQLGPIPVAGNWRRNRIASAIFGFQRGLSEGEHMPWAELGVPIALIGLTAALEFEFIDRNAVVRRGGMALGNDVPIKPAGDRFLWQAQFEQFNEHLVGWLMDDPGVDPGNMNASDQFRYLPPVGILPKESMEPRQQTQHFFPYGFAVRTHAIPYEQLDLAIEESASMLPYDLNTADRVEVLVPVPQQFYEPQLLVVETIDPEFDRTIARFALLRDQWLGRRLIVRSKASALYQSMMGRPLLYREDDPDAIDSLEQPIEFEQTLVAQGDTAQYFKGRVPPPRNWFQLSFDDNDWETGVTGIGYGPGALGTALGDMNGQYVTINLRHRFTLYSIEEGHRYKLVVATNGGFYAYLNGQYLASNNVLRPVHDATAQQAQTLEARLYELGELGDRFVEGVNVLAIQAHNPAIDSEEFSVSAELIDTEDNFGTSEVIDEGLRPPLGQEQHEVNVLAELRGYLNTSKLSAVEVAKLDEIGIEAYIEFLQAKINQADDRVDFGFLRLRTDIYRIRQMMLGNEAGTKLATSPALAQIAEADSDVTIKEELSDFYARLKQEIPVQGEGVKIGDLPVSDELRAAGTGDLGGDSIRNVVSRSASNAVGGGSKVRVDTGTVILDQVKQPGVEFDVIAPAKGSSVELFSTGKPKVATTKDVDEQNPLIGKTQNFNNVTVGERLGESSANIALMAGIAARGDILANLLETEDEGGINLEDLAIPGFGQKQGDGDEEVWVDTKKTLTEIRTEGLVDKVLSGEQDPVEGDDEAAYFNSGIKSLENAVGILRIIEGRVHAYRRVVERCRRAMAEIKVELRKTDQRLGSIGDELAEARHDVSVARALRAEEEARIEALNAKRDKVLATQVPFLVFRRPRTVDPRLDVPMHYLNPDLSDQPLPLRDMSEVEAPESLEAMLDVVRDAPLQWFQAVKLIIPHLSRLADLQVTLSGAKQRAISKITVHPFMKTNFQVPDKLLHALGATLMQSQRRVQVERRKTSLIELASFGRLGWQESIKRVPEVVSLGDLIDGNHGRMSASRRAATEMDMIARVATCLYVIFSSVPAAIRLDWSERFSQFDAAVNLRNLYSLPRFGDLEYSERYDMQRLVDWLYGRIASKYSDAHDMMSDLVRVTILAASHAPVNQLIAAYLPEPVTVKVGSRIRVVADLTRVRIGMAVSVTSAGTTAVRGRVADISGGEVMAEVHTLAGGSVQLESGARVQIGERLGMMFKN